MKEKIGGLIRLQDCDVRIKDIITRKKEGPLRMQRLEHEFNTSIIKFQKENERLETLKKDRRALEQQIQDLESKQEKSRIKLSSIKSNKEYTLVLKEIEDLDKVRTQTEDRVLQLMEEIDALEENCRQAGTELDELKKDLDSNKKEIEKELEVLDRQSANLEKLRMEFCKAVDRELLDRYHFLMERKGGVAIGSVIEGVCQACHMGIPPQKFNELIKGISLMTCPNCNRLIYWGGDEYFTKLLNDL